MTDIIEVSGSIEIIEECTETRWTFTDTKGEEEVEMASELRAKGE